MVVTASLTGSTLEKLPASATVLPAHDLQAAGVAHFGDVLGLVPNLSAAGGTSRPRYYQLRGIGETEQYEGAPNPSVGFLIDDIDFSGIGMPASLYRPAAGRSAARTAGHCVRRQCAGRCHQPAFAGAAAGLRPGR